MRLINTTTLKLEEFNETNRPPYAILSHTWGDEEITFQQMQDNASQYHRKVGYQKIAKTCEVARNSNIGYAWVDTCCIDKTSSAELSEAINSMFRWYEDAEICYAYLPDVDDISDGQSTVVRSRWFTRGWTLQELIAPRKLVFYASTWELIDSRTNLSETIADTTGIDMRLLQDNRHDLDGILKSSSIAQRMSWASKRQTTRTEDLAYCLLGIFDINMPLLYGEGTKAFTRLQQEIIRHTDDQSIFAWENTSEPDTNTSILAPSPAAFTKSGQIDQVDTGEESAPFSLTNRGIQIDLRVRWTDGHSYGIIPCRHHREGTKLLMIKLEQLNGPRFFRATHTPLEWTEEWVWKETPKIPVYLMIAPPPIKYRIPPGSFLVKFLSLRAKVFLVSEGYTWSPATRLITMDEPESRLVDRYVFGTLPVEVAWSGILLLELTQEAILFKPVLIVAASVIIWPMPGPGVELWSIEGIKDMILPSIQVKSLVLGSSLMDFHMAFLIFLAQWAVILGAYGCYDEFQ
ncbi:hypothetical protein Neosp_012155 [[Neocosmospora] mangrovei]